MEFTYNNNIYKITSITNSDHIIKIIENSKSFYEIKLLEEIKNLNLKGTYIDIGANIGNHTIFFAKETKASKVVSFEINRVIYDKLKENCENNKSKKYEIYNIGLFSSRKFVTLSNIDKNNVGMTHIIDNTKGNIMVDKLDNIINKEYDISLIKIDVEGAEVDVILGSIDTIKNFKPIIIAELKDNIIYEDFFNILKPIGYSNNKINYCNTPTYIFKC